MKYLITGLTISMLSTAAMAGATAPPTVSVPEPGMLGLFAASVAALFIAKKFRK
ncbi:PEP-CTERM sorting domain-containing protein [Marinobacter orientalis]|uniref:PEP-CTERM sorting domain-containing protein n=1 Tax=Marinobacter orientalis TaxID=1928859 RepID=A0A7Y0RF50_9GAMM|nr:PEP-CTERM sorting domain-containing protein [Marinobacter orientalis]NMT65106.1 PEP-CTERM sorting domain-containing protein [Marinobacter orientalis]TGX48947.1 PEP-CTERM sorting domain-containing protein [Marinobacter orientalis]